MRLDVKLGIVISAGIVLLAGTYFSFRGQDEAPVPVGGEGTKVSDAFSPEKPATKQPRVNKPAARKPAVNKPAPSTRQPVARRSTAPGRRNPVQTKVPQARKTPVGQRKPVQPKPVARTPVAGNGAGRPITNLPAARRPARSPGSSGVDPADRLARGGVPKQNPPARNADSNKAAVPVTRSAPAGGQPIKPVPLAGRAQPASGRSAAADDVHRVQPGDTFTAIALRYYGSVKHLDALIRANPRIADPDRLRVGQTVRIPEMPNVPPVTRATPVTTGAARTYKVVPGDSLYTIAAGQLGDPSRWEELYDLNRAMIGDDPSRLKVDQVLKLPSR